MAIDPLDRDYQGPVTEKNDFGGPSRPGLAG